MGIGYDKNKANDERMLINKSGSCRSNKCALHVFEQQRTAVRGIHDDFYVRSLFFTVTSHPVFAHGGEELGDVVARAAVAVFELFPLPCKHGPALLHKRLRLLHKRLP